MANVVPQAPALTFQRIAAALLLALCLALPGSAEAATSGAKQACAPHVSSCSRAPSSKSGIEPVKSTAAKPTHPAAPLVQAPKVQTSNGPSVWDNITSFLLTWMPLI